MRHLPAWALAGSLAVLLAGCGGGNTAKGTATRFVNYMKHSKYLEAAKMWDYDTDARRENPDWDTFGESQRNLIIEKLAEGKSKTMAMWESRFTGTHVAEVTESGDTATARLAGGGVTSLDLKKIKDQWKIEGIN